MLERLVLAAAEVQPELSWQIRALLDDAFDGDFSEDDWEHTQGGWHVILADAGLMVAHAAVVARVLQIDGRPYRCGYVEGVATLRARQHQGLGSLVMAGVAPLLQAEFECGVLSTGRHRFYERLGWERWRGPTFVLRDGQRIRTPDEDDGIMVLRFGPSRELELTASIACEARQGDDW